MHYSRDKILISYFILKTPFRNIAIRILLLPLLIAACGQNPNVQVATGDRVENFALLDHLGDFHELYYYSDFKAVVLFVHGIGCQIVRNQIPTIQKLRHKFEGKGIKFLGINANLSDNRETISVDTKELGIDFPILIDEAQHVLKSLDVTRTSEVILIETASWRIAYRGPVDDRLDYGIQKATARQPFLHLALESLLANQKIEQPKVDSPGCLIQFRPHNVSDLSYQKSIAPILRRRCTTCHIKGGAAPFPMDSYRAVFGWSPMIREVIRTKLMPPWRIDPLVGHFPDVNILKPKEEQLILDWIDAGSPGNTENDPLKELADVSNDKWQLGQPDIIVDFDQQFIPATGLLKYRYAVADVGNQKDLWVKAVDIKPSKPELMHHALLFDGHNFELETINNLLDVELIIEKWFYENKFWSRIFASYAPGIGPFISPRNSGMFLPAGSTIAAQFHYKTNGRAMVDRSKVGLYLFKKPPKHKLESLALINHRFSIPSHIKRFPVRKRKEIKDDVVIYSVRPHMHYRGRSMELWTIPLGEDPRLVLSVPNYSFDWQAYYRFEEPLTLRAGSHILAKGIYDNSAQNRYNPDPSKTVSWGETQINDEMFILYLYYITETTDNIPLLSKP